mgnify:CR=1 FL=1
MKPLEKEFADKYETAWAKRFVEVSLKSDPARSTVIYARFMERHGIYGEVKKMKIYPDDVWIVAFMKCGTTWTQEMAWMINSNLDYKMAARVKLEDRFPQLE